ncbi:MAG: nicotinate (nicotinamide) nucleotide adenylyltransferase [Omnitrophica bacterium GWA2_52_8]|nr:MAG: nicotinate (nicotinamide) nucleotide adenylyltransferase [Omnitrophica bacterium GWA2_52_8]
MKLGILGGTFDPIHQGHLALAEAALKQFLLDKILFIPAAIPPHKTDCVSLTSGEIRLKMVQLAIRYNKCFEASDLELVRPGVSYTVDTLRQLKKKYPADKLFLILGQDSFESLSSWHEPQEIRCLADILVARRDGAHEQSGETEHHEIMMKEVPVSASMIRRSIYFGKKVDEKELPLPVAEFIRQGHLYLKTES